AGLQQVFRVRLGAADVGVVLPTRPGIASAAARRRHRLATAEPAHPVSLLDQSDLCGRLRLWPDGNAEPGCRRSTAEPQTAQAPRAVAGVATEPPRGLH